MPGPRLRRVGRVTVSARDLRAVSSDLNNPVVVGKVGDPAKKLGGVHHRLATPLEDPGHGRGRLPLSSGGLTGQTLRAHIRRLTGSKNFSGKLEVCFAAFSFP